MPHRLLPAIVILTLASAPALAVERVPFLAFFDATVFGADTSGVPSRERVLKATTPMTIELHGDADGRWLPFVTAYAATLGELTGLAVDARETLATAAPVEAGRIAVYIAPRRDFAAIVDQPWIPPGWRAGLVRSLCFFVTFGRETVRGALVVVDRNLADDTIRHCLLEETAQAFGVVNDSPLMGGSIFNDRGPLQAAPTETDRLVLEVLYDPRIVAGMPRAEALALAGQIYDERSARAAD
jgi:hypothetical protein